MSELAGDGDHSMFTLTVEERLYRLNVAVRDLRAQHIETRGLIPDQFIIEQFVSAKYEQECGRLERLRDDAVRVLNLLVEKGLVTRADLNAAIAGDG